MAVLNGWWHLMPMVLPPLICMSIVKNSTNMEDLRRIIERTVANTASRQSLEISKFYLTDDMLKDIVKLDLD